jgi:hypothetical protein
MADDLNGRRIRSKDLVWVRARDCQCPGTPHSETDGGRGDGDWVGLAPTLPLLGGLEVMALSGTSPDPVVTGARAGAIYVRHGVREWNLIYLSERDVALPLPVTPDTVEAEFADWQDARPIVSKVLELYGDAFAPLGQKKSRSSPAGPTDALTSAKTSTGESPPAH